MQYDNKAKQKGKYNLHFGYIQKLIYFKPRWNTVIIAGYNLILQLFVTFLSLPCKWYVKKTVSTEL